MITEATRKGAGFKMSDYIRRDPLAFEKLWDAIVIPWWQEHADEPGVSFNDVPIAKQRLMDAYHYLNEYCSDSYMDSPDPPLNQRKIAACLLFAIAATRPLTIDMSVAGCMESPKRVDGSLRVGSSPFYANERLAICVACSVVLAYLETAVRDKDRCLLTESQRDEAFRAIDRGIDLLEEKDGGAWLLNFEKALALTAVEGNINIPLMSCLVAYLEATVLETSTYQEVLKAFDSVSKESMRSIQGVEPFAGLG